jgi:PhnB protein
MSSESTSSTPVGYNTLNPYLTVKDVPTLIAFLQDAFGALVTQQVTQPDGRIEHAELRVGDSLLMIGPPEVDGLIRTHEDHSPGTFYVFVSDVDATYSQAMAHGAAAWAMPTDTFYGDRVAAVTDTNGNVWWLATRLTQLSDEQRQARADQHWRRKSATR